MGTATRVFAARATIIGMAFTMWAVWLLVAAAADQSASSAPPDFVLDRDFSWTALAEPENLFWPGYCREIGGA